MPSTETIGNGNPLTAGFDEDSCLPVHLTGNAHRQRGLGNKTAISLIEQLRAIEAHVHVYPGKINHHPRWRQTTHDHLHREGLDHGNWLHAARQLDTASAGQQGLAGTPVEITAGLRLHRQISLGQQDGGKLVANDHH